MNKTALITGASSGIGRELAKLHSQKGGNAVIVARTESKLVDLKKELEQKYSVQITPISVDLSQAGSAVALYDEIKNKGIQIDYLLNNAGFGLRGKFHELDWKRQAEMIQLNMVTLTELMHLYIPEMLERNYGRVLNTGSTASFMPGPLQAVYYASKSYVQFLSNAIAEELKDTNVSITNLMPGVTDTGFGKTAGMENTELFKKAVSPTKVAKEGYEAMLKGKLDVISGLTLAQRVMISLVPFTPKKIILNQVRKLQEE